MEDMRLSILLVKDSAAFVCLFEAPSLNLLIFPNMKKDKYQVSKYWPLICKDHPLPGTELCKYVSTVYLDIWDEGLGTDPDRRSA